jgi:hypothetical protein
MENKTAAILIRKLDRTATPQRTFVLGGRF